ncbi:hypothetical protein G6F40_017068 [Rhizopus arrhizus]|nr:hypothetical protein G6F40_017068 [Rhizopus arrhizus]
MTRGRLRAKTRIDIHRETHGKRLRSIRLGRAPADHLYRAVRLLAGHPVRGLRRGRDGGGAAGIGRRQELEPVFDTAGHAGQLRGGGHVPGLVRGRRRSARPGRPRPPGSRRSGSSADSAWAA